MLFADPQTVEARRVACDDCEFLKEGFLVGPICRKCGCALRVKTVLLTAECPVGRW